MNDDWKAKLEKNGEYSIRDNSGNKVNAFDYFFKDGVWCYNYGTETMIANNPGHLEALKKYLRKEKLKKLLT